MPERNHSTSKKDLVPSNHGIELNRDFTNMIQYGFIEGMFKIKKSGLPDCTQEGMTLARAMHRMGTKMGTDETQDDDFLNWFQLYIAFMTRCNYMATMQGVIVSRQIGEAMDQHGGFIGAVIQPFWMAFEVLVNFCDDIYILATALMGFSNHKDLFNLSLILGKLLKMAF